MSADIPESICCPITHLPMKHPMVDHEGHSYEKKAIYDWLKTKNVSPITNNPLFANNLQYNYKLRDSIKTTMDALGLSFENDSNDSDDDSDDADENENNLSMNISSCEDKILLSVVPNVGKYRTATDICCIIDTSGSMAQHATIKTVDGVDESYGLTILDIVKHAVKTIIKNLSPLDTLSLVQYNQKATLVLSSTPMTNENKEKAIKITDSLSSGGQTNLWDGMCTGFSTIKNSKNHNRVLFLLTDGCPNINPPSGYIPALKHYIQQNGINATLNTFGFGYNLDSQLLNDLSNYCHGSYNFIPDGSFVGTIFVNALSNVLAVAATNVSIQLLNRSNIESFGYSLDTLDNNINVGPIIYGQSKDIVIKVDNNSKNAPIEAKLTYKNMANGKVLSQSFLSSTSIEFNQISDHIERLMVSSTLQETIRSIHDKLKNDIGYNKTHNNIIQTELQNKYEELSAYITYLKSFPTKTEYISNLILDLEGQVSDALSKVEWYNKWGKHYIPSLARAHQYQICNNFKDPGIQLFGGDLFRLFRQQIEDIFVTIPPPVPADKSYRGPITQSMSSHYSASGPCFSGESLIKMNDGDYQQIKSVQKGDILFNNAKVICVIKTMCKDNRENLIRLSNDLYITPYHPYYADNVWKFPYDSLSHTITANEYNCDAIYNLVLDSFHIVDMDGNLCVTLGHGFSSNRVVFHEYFGTDKIINDFKKKKKSEWNDGLIILKPNCMIRDEQTFEVCGFEV